MPMLVQDLQERLVLVGTNSGLLILGRTTNEKMVDGGICIQEPMLVTEMPMGKMVRCTLRPLLMAIKLPQIGVQPAFWSFLDKDAKAVLEAPYERALLEERARRVGLVMGKIEGEEREG